MFYTIYKVTNKINGKFYIGKHKTKDLNDGYMGSGKLIRRAIAKHGIDNFEKKILHIFDTEEEMNAKEKELVIISEMSYNLCEGGKGGFGYLNNPGYNNPTHQREHMKKLSLIAISKYPNGTFTGPHTQEAKKKISSKNKGNQTWLGRNHSMETKLKMKKSKNVGVNNSQYGTMWITNGTINKKCDKSMILPVGWYAGRILKA